jgi:hypothetical protein
LLPCPVPRSAPACPTPRPDPRVDPDPVHPRPRALPPTSVRPLPFPGSYSSVVLFFSSPITLAPTPSLPPPLALTNFPSPPRPLPFP